MARDEVDLSGLVGRMDRIERANRYLRLATIFLLLTLVFSVTTTLLSQETMTPPDLRGKMVGPPDLRAQTVQSERWNCARRTFDAPRKTRARALRRDWQGDVVHLAEGS
jgi:hypothetical protein